MVLICLVVSGHLLECTSGDIAHYLYISTYLFHMPLFVFCTGYFSRFSARRILTSLVWPYLVFQLLYLLFTRFVLESEIEFRFTTPYWILWYLLSTAIWHSLIPLLESCTRINPIIVSLILFAIGLAVGFDDNVGYFMSLSRTFVFFPFFALGRFAVENKSAFREFTDSRRVGIIFVLASVCVLVIAYFIHGGVDQKWLYGSYSYSAGGYSVLIRAAVYAAGFVICVGFFCVMPNRRFWFTYIGGNSLTIYLLHGFIVKLAPRLTGLVESSIIRNLLLASVGVAIVFVLSLPSVKRILAPLFTFPFGSNDKTSTPNS